MKRNSTSREPIELQYYHRRAEIRGPQRVCVEFKSRGKKIVETKLYTNEYQCVIKRIRKTPYTIRGGQNIFGNDLLRLYQYRYLYIYIQNKLLLLLKYLYVIYNNRAISEPFFF